MDARRASTVNNANPSPGKANITFCFSQLCINTSHFRLFRLLSKNLRIKIYKTILLPVVLYGCEAWSLTLRGECRLRVFENGVLRRIYGPKKDENGEWRMLHNEELHSLYYSPNIVRMIKSRRPRWAGHVARMEEGRSSFKILTGKPTGKRPLGKPRRRWDEIRMDLKEIGITMRNWVDSAQDRDYWRALVNAALNLRVP